ncbi:CocE/NonD family hydrolase [Tahibacter soli]|uniref:CocE/NonD family hydrolase n=1 Tax=Tahibacter soli TaxID=2983605 RepID=A0A9X3YLQ0_9GAMM|nr:CocE/NonD family hydrolase [Tahibacter soli]MDC8013008.1 CocE/NonD family hydrolase [Tahibacter soli]
MIRSALPLLAAVCAGAAVAAPMQSATAGWQWGVKIPLRDGVKLNATLYRPAPDTKIAACVFTLTPYVSQTYHDRGQYFSKNGYTFLTIDVRGRGNSEGRFTPLAQEVDDVRDVVEWLGRQPYCGGKVSMWGGSYAGYNQWLAAKWRLPALRGIVPAAAPWPGYDFPSNSGIFLTYNPKWLTLTSGKTAQDDVFGDLAYWDAKMTEWVAQNRPYDGLDADLGNPNPIFKDWVKHPMRDAYWDKHGPAPRDFAAMDLPILSIVGQYDILTPGALEFYRMHMLHASEAAKAKHYLVLGPWDHAGTRTPRAKIGNLAIGAAGLLDLNALNKAWYDYTLKGGPKPEFLKKRVAYYVLGAGAEEWRYADTLEAVTAEERPYYLASDRGEANDIFRSGRLERDRPPTPQTPDAYVYDPLATPPEDPMYDFQFVTQHGLPMQAYGKQMLIYHGAPLTEATEIAGRPRLKVWLSLDQPDTDLMAWLYEVRPDGSNVMLGFDLMRARYRESLRVARPVVPGAIEPYDFDEFMFVARRLEKGSRLRLVIGPTPRKLFEHNYNSGGVVSAESGKDARTVTVTLHHDAERPSALYLPMARPVPR